MMEILAFIGVIALVFIGALAVTVGIDIVGNFVAEKRRQYKIKHRFDKPPLAKCYCIDCRFYDDERKHCYGFHDGSGRKVADDFFCCEADPM